MSLEENNETKPAKEGEQNEVDSNQHNNNNMFNVNDCFFEKDVPSIPASSSSLFDVVISTTASTSGSENDSNVAQKIFESSLQFENSQAPRSEPSDDRRQSFTSLYPSISSIGDVERDGMQVEKTWKAAGRAKKKAVDDNGGNVSEPASRYERIEERYTSYTEHRFAASSAAETFPFLAIGKPNAAAARVASLQNIPLNHPNNHPFPLQHEQSLRHHENPFPFGPLHRRHGSPPPVHPLPSHLLHRHHHHHHHHNPRHLSRNPTRHSDEDEGDNLIALKRAAYEGSDVVTGRMGMSVARMPMSDQEAEVVIVDDYSVHPFEIPVSAVQADFVGRDYNSQFNFDGHTIARQTTTTEASGYFESFGSLAGTGDEDAMEATVIDSGTMAKATVDAWDASTIEAAVLEESCNTIVDLDSKPPARDIAPEANLEAFQSQQIPHARDAEAEATVVDYQDHPSNLVISSNAIHAELIGQDYNLAIDYEGNDFQTVAAASDTEFVHETMETSRHTTETHSVKIVPTEACARIIRDNNRVESAAIEPETISSSKHNSQWATCDTSVGVENFVLTDGEAEVVGITEDIHPSELVDNTTQAEWIGTNSNYVITIPSDQHQQGCIDNFVEFETEEVQVTHETVADAALPNGQAEVVGIIEGSHPSEFIDSTTQQAELIGTDSNCTIAVASRRQQQEIILESSKLPTEEAPVLKSSIHAVDIPTIEDEIKQTSNQNSQWGNSQSTGGDNFASADGEAEVIVITEETHPLEFVESDATQQAELIDIDSTIPSSEAQDITTDNYSEANQSSKIMIEEDLGVLRKVPSPPASPVFEPREARATIINETDFSSFERQGSAMAELAGTSQENTIPNTPVTPVAILHLQDVNQIDTIPKSPLKAAVPTIKNSIDRSNHSLSNPFNDAPRTSVLSPSQPVMAVIGRSTVENNESTGNEVPAQSIEPIPVETPRNLAPNGTLQAFLPGSIVRSTSNLMEMLFGNMKLPNNEKSPNEIFVKSLHQRTLLPSSIVYSETSDSWVTTINTSQKTLEVNNVQESSKSRRAFSVPTRKEALCLAQGWSPPKMHPFESNTSCLICDNPFSVFKRACHCRNCGVCVCSSCSVQWPAKMLPNTYNIKTESFMNICKTCDWLCSAFRLALLDGDRDKSIALHATGNVNLTTPFANVKGELFYPVHCAVLGGNLQLLKWLIEEHCCPLRSIRISSAIQSDCHGSYTPILTSTGRSLLGIALENKIVGIVRYLVVDKRMSISTEKGLTIEMLGQNLDLVLRVLSEEALEIQRESSETKEDASKARHISASTLGSSELQGSSLEDDCGDAAGMITTLSDAREGEAGRSQDDCIICFSRGIDCVATPCGHQMCCLECSSHIQRCPVCATECSFMRVYRP